jgi:hypothetical protein
VQLLRRCDATGGYHRPGFRAKDPAATADPRLFRLRVGNAQAQTVVDMDRDLSSNAVRWLFRVAYTTLTSQKTSSEAKKAAASALPTVILGGASL